MWIPLNSFKCLGTEEVAKSVEDHNGKCIFLLLFLNLLSSGCLSFWVDTGVTVFLLLGLVLRHYMVRYREKNRKWNYQTCPTRETVIDNLKPNTVYEFGVQPNSKDGTGIWSKPVIHNISTVNINGMYDVSVVKVLKKWPDIEINNIVLNKLH